MEDIAPCHTPPARLPHAGPAPAVRGLIKSCAEDFQVEELLGFAPDGEGEHVLLQVRKRNANTAWVARRVAQLAGVKPVDVGYAGLKDRLAVTTQWLTVRLAGRPEPDWRSLESENLTILAVARHRRKLQRGALRGNRFKIVVRGLSGERESLSGRIEQVARRGVPNYFGAQRFGRAGGNLEKAAALFGGRVTRAERQLRGLYLSAVRGLLFNRVLAQRVLRRSWNRAIAGDALMLDGRHSLFTALEVTQDIERRVTAGALHPTGPLWGRGAAPMAGDALALEQDCLQECTQWCEGLERMGLKHERRALRVMVQDLSWELCPGDELRLGFFLPAGAYATMVLRELLQFSQEQGSTPEDWDGALAE